MTINPGDLFRWKSCGDLMEVTGTWLTSQEYRCNHYRADGRPDCGANGQHNTAVNLARALTQGEIEKIAPLPTKRALIRTANYGNYYGKRFMVGGAYALPTANAPANAVKTFQSANLTNLTT